MLFPYGHIHTGMNMLHTESMRFMITHWHSHQKVYKLHAHTQNMKADTANATCWSICHPKTTSVSNCYKSHPLHLILLLWQKQISLTLCTLFAIWGSTYYFRSVATPACKCILRLKLIMFAQMQCFLKKRAAGVHTIATRIALHISRKW